MTAGLWVKGIQDGRPCSQPMESWTNHLAVGPPATRPAGLRGGVATGACARSDPQAKPVGLGAYCWCPGRAKPRGLFCPRERRNTCEPFEPREERSDEIRAGLAIMFDLPAGRRKHVVLGRGRFSSGLVSFRPAERNDSRPPAEADGGSEVERAKSCRVRAGRGRNRVGT
jgi:hypothetical protein